MISPDHLAAMVIGMMVDCMDNRKPAVAKLNSLGREFTLTVARFKKPEVKKPVKTKKRKRAR
jgi:hypothetical protein